MGKRRESGESGESGESCAKGIENKQIGKDVPKAEKREAEQPLRTSLYEAMA